MLKTYEVSVFRLHSAGENKKVPLSHGNLIPIISSKRKRKADVFKFLQSKDSIFLTD